MQEIKQPSWRLINWRDKAATISEEQIKLWREETDKYNEQIDKLSKTNNEIYMQMFALAETIYGKRSSVLRYLSNNRPDAIFRLSYDFERIIEDAKKELTAKKEKENKSKNEKELLAKAVLWLKEKGKELGKDYQVTEAVYTANNIAFEEEIEKRKKLGGYIEFSGDDNCEDCEGWDMETGRCQCGNRRVSWDSSGNFLNISIYAEAY